ncbi:hypothetical protein BV22DRAFT_1027342, partial [Leucogyrophana mollusca]
HDLALVLPFDAPTGAQRRTDKELGLTRVRAKPRTLSKIVTLRSFVRGALLAPDVNHPGDFFVVDSIDTDMFIRMKGKL